MTGVSMSKKRSLKWASTIILTTGLLMSPVSAFASTVLPVQILPPTTTKACAPVTFSDIQAHVYSGNLDSFDITVSDPSYIAVSTKVGDTAIPYNYITRWNNPDGSVKVHVDLQSMSVYRDIPVQMVFISAHMDQSGNGVTCLFQVPATISLKGAGIGHVTPGAPGQTPSAHIPHPRPTPEPTSTSGTSTTATSTRNPGVVGAMSSLGNLCSDGGATRLWVVLLVLFALFCFMLCAQRFEVNSSVRDWNIGLILAVFVGLLIFWYVSAACRTGAWAPAIATLITIVGLLYTMLKGDDTQEILLLKDSKKE